MENYCVELAKWEFTECCQILMNYSYQEKGYKCGLDILTSVLIIMTVVGTSIRMFFYVCLYFFIFLKP